MEETEVIRWWYLEAYFRTVQSNVLPLSLRNVVYSKLHTNMGHLGPERVVQLAWESFFWPHMQRDITNFITRRCRCVKQKPPAFKQREPLMQIHSATPFEIISIDCMHFEKRSGGHEYMLVIVDHFTRYAQAYATKDKSGKTAARLLFNNVILRYCYPIRILHDQGSEFESLMFRTLEEISNIGNSRTTPYHPECNGKTERFNRTLLSMLQTLPETYKSHWRDHLPKLVHAYNCTRHDSTEFSPFFLLFGRSPRLPIDLVFGLKKGNSESSYPAYVKNWKTAMQQAYEIGNAKSQPAATQGKTQYDKKAKSESLFVTSRKEDQEKSALFGKIASTSYWSEWMKKVPRMLYNQRKVKGVNVLFTVHCYTRVMIYPIDDAVECERSKKKVMRNGSRNVANARKGSDQARGVDGDDNEINVGWMNEWTNRS